MIVRAFAQINVTLGLYFIQCGHVYVKIDLSSILRIIRGREEL